MKIINKFLNIQNVEDIDLDDEQYLVSTSISTGIVQENEYTIKVNLKWKMYDEWFEHHWGDSIY